jgi:molybdopterin converting factor small subunit
MQLIVEFLGPSRRLAQTKETTLEVADRATYRDVLRQLATRYPSLVDDVIVPSTFDLSPAFILNANGRRAITDLDVQPEEGQRLIIMVMEAGG